MGKRKTTEEYKSEANEVHNNFYDYSLVEYINAHSYITLICPVHGEFIQKPYHHLSGQGCPKCVRRHNFTTKDFINESNIIHDNFYDYSLSNYEKAHTKIKIICPDHGVFEQTPINHLYGQGCPKCWGRNKTTKEFTNEANIVHNNFYDYSLANYVRSKIKIKIICPIHGVFEQMPNNHLNGAGCPKCENKNVTPEEFKNKSNIIHNNFYDYSLGKYVGSKIKLKIICPIHGIFLQKPNNHLMGAGCPKCAGKNVTTEEFTNKANIIHNYKFDYSLVVYKNNTTKIKIICPIHGIFEQVPSDHLSGYGCKRCSESKGELKIAKYLDEHNIEYVREKTFNDCRNKLPLHFDFYLPKYNLMIEYDGQQHFKSIKYFGGESNLKKCQINDEIKNKFAKNNDINLLRIKYTEINNIEEILKNIL